MNQEYLYKCPNCLRDCLVAAEYTGQTIACPFCQKEFFATEPDPLTQVILPKKLPFFKSGKLELLKEQFEILISDGDLSDQDETLLGQVTSKLGLSSADFENLRDDLFMKDFSTIKKTIESSCHVSDEDLEQIDLLIKKYGVKNFQLDGFASLYREIFCLETKNELPNTVNSSLILDKEETCFKEINTDWIQSKKQGQGHKIIDKGVLIVTNKALRFNGENRNTSIMYGRITNLTVFSNGLKIDKTTGMDDLFSMNGAQARFIKAIVMFHKSR